MATEKRLIWGDIAESQLKKLADHYHGSFSGDAFERAMQLIAELPSVDAVKVEHGRWDDTIYDCFKVCSVCELLYIPKEALERGTHRYCPNCGAKMDGERKDNESSCNN